MKLTIETFCKNCGAFYEDVLPPFKIDTLFGVDPIEVCTTLKCGKCSKKFTVTINS